MSKIEENVGEEILKVLKDIKMLLEPKPAPPPKKSLWNEFIDFISKYKVLGLAVAFIMGVYVGQVVQSLVKDILMPLIGLALPGLGNLSTLRIAVPPTALDPQGNPIDPNWTGQLFGIGNFLVSIITFIIVAFVIFLIVKITKKWGME
ncbi:MAG: MscL family protein [Candidatus Methanomethylicia archaeon]